VIKPLTDGRRAVQFMRLHADQFNIDPDRIILSGSSAGAGLSLLIAFQDDAALPNDPDPVLRQSTRVSGAAVWETQATYDLERWSTDVFATYNVDVVANAVAA
jgi:acetyl esterase/lipase